MPCHLQFAHFLSHLDSLEGGSEDHDVIRLAKQRIAQLEEATSKERPAQQEANFEGPEADRVNAFLLGDERMVRGVGYGKV